MMRNILPKKDYQVFDTLRNPNGKMHFTVGYTLTCAV